MAPPPKKPLFTTLFCAEELLICKKFPNNIQNIADIIFVKIICSKFPIMRAFLHTLFTHIITVPLQVPFFKYLSNLQRLFVTLEIQLSCLNKFYFFVYPDFSLFITTVKYKGVSNLKSIYGPYHHLIVYRR